MQKVIWIFSLLFLSSCLGMPKGVEPVNGFNLNKYLGKWYEIARLDHSFEKGLSQVTAEYSLMSDGGVQVFNRGFAQLKNKWQESKGKAYFVQNENQGHLKVSFFGPFYGSYVIFELDENYQYAFVAGHNTKYLWLLSRTPAVEPQVMQKFIAMSKERGFNTENLIYVKQP